MHLTLTLEQASVLGDALNFYRRVQEWNTEARHATSDEIAAAKHRLRILDEIQAI